MGETRPNILFLMADQMAAPALPVYGHPVVEAPALAALAARGVVFETAYCNFPLCAPSRFSMLTGRLPSAIGAFDNAAEFPAGALTMAHYLRLMGYRTCAAGKMHFVGPDQLHGFEERITTDIYPADFSWVPDWTEPGERLEWHHSMVNVVEAGPSARSLQIDYDDEVAFAAERAIYDFARDGDERPFFLMVSFSHPHDPYTTTPEFWGRYDDSAIDMPAVAPIASGERDAHSQRLWQNYDGGRHAVTAEHVRNARHAYYGMISWVDDRIAGLLGALAAAGLDGNTIVVFTSDHGDMLGERGMWFKMSFLEWSARVPLIVSAPGRFAPRRVAAPVSLVDLLPTLLDLAGDGAPAPADPLDGTSLAPLMAGAAEGGPEAVAGEYLAEGTAAPCFMLRRGRYKYIACDTDPPQLFDLEADPRELENLAGSADHGEVETAMAAGVARRWDGAALRERVLASQRRRRLVFEALMTGERSLWDYRPPRDASRDYIRNLGGLYETETRARLPVRGGEGDNRK